MLCATKALLDATPSLSDLLRPIVSPTTSIVLLQNGVGAEIPLHESFPDNTIISAVVWTGAKSVEGGVEQFNEEGLTIGVDYRDGGNTKVKEEEDGRLRELTGWLEKGGGSCNVTEDIQSQRWIKVIWWVLLHSRYGRKCLRNWCRNCCW